MSDDPFVPDAVQPGPVEGCGSCRFWWREKSRRGGLGWGQCRRMPPALPIVRTDKLKLVGIWPETEADDWCGEWQGHPDGPTGDGDAKSGG
jgi:hypothetical protein